MPMLFPKSADESPSGEISSAGCEFNYDLRPSSPAKDNDRGVHQSPARNSPLAGDHDLPGGEDLQEMSTNLQCSDECKDENVGSTSVSDDSRISLEPRRRTQALDKSRNPVDFHLDTAL